MLAGAKLEEENKLVASWWFRIHLGWGEMGELNLRNMVELVVDFTRDTLLVVNSSETCTIRAEYHTLILIMSFVGALTSDGQEVRGCHWTTNRFGI